MGEKNAKEIKVRADTSIDDIVDTLNSLTKISAERFFVNFNGVKLYSGDYPKLLDVDDAYQQVYGNTRREFFRKRNGILDEHNKEHKQYKEEVKSMIAKKIEEGKKYIYPERLEEWEELLNGLSRFAPGLNDGKRPDLMIECLKKLENGEEFQSVLDFIKGVDDGSLGLAGEILRFSKVGPEFYEYVYRKENPEVLEVEYYKKELETTKRENSKLKKLHKLDEKNQSQLQKRQVSVSEVGEVAKGITLGITTEAMDAVTNPKDEPIIENNGQSHDNE